MSRGANTPDVCEQDKPRNVSHPVADPTNFATGRQRFSVFGAAYSTWATSNSRTSTKWPAMAAAAAMTSAGAALVRRQNVRVNADAHAAACVAPLESCRRENPVQPFFFRLRLDAARTRHNQRLLDVFRHSACGPRVAQQRAMIEPRVRTGADDHLAHNGCTGPQAQCPTVAPVEVCSVACRCGIWTLVCRAPVETETFKPIIHAGCNSVSPLKWSPAGLNLSGRVSEGPFHFLI